MLAQLLEISRSIGGELFGTFESNAHGRIRGAMLGVDDYWFNLALLNQIEGKYPCSSLETIRERSYWDQFTAAPYWGQLPPMDLSYRPINWGDHRRTMGYPEGTGPIFILAIVRHPDDLAASDLPRTFQQQFPILYEYWPPSTTYDLLEEVRERVAGLQGAVDRLQGNIARPDLSIGRAEPRTAGTVGGFLRHPGSSRIFAVSCAHVLGQIGTETLSPGPYEGRGSEPVGRVRGSWIAAPLPQNGAAPNPAMLPTEARLDLAIAEVDGGLDRAMSQLARPSHVRSIASMRPGDPVTFYGKVSGAVEAKIRYLQIWDEIEDKAAKQRRCFRDLFVLAPRQRQYVYAPLSRPGDSGSWVLYPTEDTAAWDGMVIAGDGFHTQCCFAEYIMEACNAAPPIVPGGLALLP